MRPSTVPLGDICTSCCAPPRVNGCGKQKHCLIPNPSLCPQLDLELLRGWGSHCSKLMSLPRRHKICSRTCGCLEEYRVPTASPVHVDGEAAASRRWFLAAFKLAGFAEPLTMVFPRGAAHGRAQGWLLPCLCSFGAGMLVAGTAAALPAAGHGAAAPTASKPAFFFSMQSTRNGKSRQGLCFSSSSRSAEPWPLLDLARFVLHVPQAVVSHPGISLLTEGFQPGLISLRRDEREAHF